MGQADRNWTKRAQALFYETDLEAFQDLYQDYSLREIGILMGVSDGAVNNRMKNTLKMPMKPKGGANHEWPKPRKTLCKYCNENPMSYDSDYYCASCKLRVRKEYADIESRGYI